MERVIVSEPINAYLDQLHRDEHPVVQEMEKLAAARDFPIVGPQVGRLLRLLAGLVRAETILELGSGFGYSAFFFASALPDAGRVHLTDLDPARLEQARRYLAEAGLAEKAEFHAGDALATARSFPGPVDILFNDVDKEQYPEVVALGERLLRPGGLLITDNALWHGKVADPSAADEATEGVRRYNRLALEHPAFETVILPVRDGVAISRRR